MPVVMEEFAIDEISAVDAPAMEGARISIMKRRAPAAKADNPQEQENPGMTPEEKIAELEAQLKAALAELDAAKAKAAEPAPGPADGAPAETAEMEPEVEVEIEAAKRAPEVVFVSDDGTEYTKSHDPALVKMARERDADRKALREEISKRHRMELAKRAGVELSHLPGAEDHKVALLAAIDAIGDEATRKAVTAIVHANDAGLAEAMKRRGTTGGEMPESGATPESRLDAMAKSYVADKSAADYAKAYDMALRSPEGARIYSQIKTPGATPPVAG